MADILTSIIGNFNITDPINIGINLILSTLIGGIVMLIVLEIIAKEFHESVNPMHAFLLVLLINIINIVGLLGIVASLISFPLIWIILPIVIWIVLVKLLFRDLKISHVLIVAIIGYIITIYLIPYIVGFVRSFIPF
jgi:hypothetical protein